MSTPVRLAVLMVWGVLALGASVRPSVQAPAGGMLPLDLGPEDTAYRGLFTPSSSPPGTFTVYRSAEDIRALAARLRSFDAAPAPGAWDVDRTGVFDAFGAEPPYDKGRLARLFGGSSPWVARGSLATPRGRIGVALISPYPDLAIRTLRQGTLVIVTRLRSEATGSVLSSQSSVISFSFQSSVCRSAPLKPDSELAAFGVHRNGRLKTEN